MGWTPAAISKFIAENQYRMDGPAQWTGDEPNNRRGKSWDASTVRVLLAASWPYEHAAGNQSIPAVWKAVNEHHSYLCDRYYLPSTPRDMRIFERGGVPVFGIEHRHPLQDYDIVGTSISYVVLLMNFVKYLSLSGVPLRWRDRVPEEHPMIMVGGQAFCNPEVMAPVVDCVFVGEAEDEPGNGGIGQVLRMVEMLKADGSWNEDRLACYERLARTFNYLYFPRLVEVRYGDRDGSKQVTGYRSSVAGMRMPFRKRHVIDLDKISPLDDPPLLYTNPSMGSGDVEASRGCIGEDEHLFLPGQGIVRLGDFAGDLMHPVGLETCIRQDSGHVSHVLDNGVRPVVTIGTREGHSVTCTPDHRIWTDRGWVEAQFLVSGDKIPVYFGQKAFGSEQELDSSASALRRSTNFRHPVDGVRSGNRASALNVPAKLNADLAWLIGFMTGDGGMEADGRGVFFMTRTEEPEVADRVHSLMFALFGLRPTVKSRPGVPVKYHYFYSKPLVRWLSGNFGYGTGRATPQSKLYVPRLVLQSPRSVHEAYLLGLFEADMACAGKSFYLSTISERLARQVAAMLLNLGVPCSVSSRVRKSEKGFGGTDWAVTLRKLPQGCSWVRMTARWKDAALGRYRKPRIGSCAPLEVTGRCGHVFVTRAKAQSYPCPVCGRGIRIRRKKEDGYREPEYMMTTVREVISRAPMRVLDLHVPAQEAFNASGMVVHNCPAWCSRPVFLSPHIRPEAVPAAVGGVHDRVLEELSQQCRRH